MFKTASQLILLSFCLSSAAVAQVMPYRMTTNQVTYQININSSNQGGAPPAGDTPTRAAAATWTNVGSRFQLVDGGFTSVTENYQNASYDTPGVQISTRPASFYNDCCWHALTWWTLATTTTASDADITVNNDRIAAGHYYYGTGTPPSNQYDYQSLLTHEFGHVAGFQHDPDSTHTTCVMRSNLLPAQLKRTPCGAEATALRNKYP
jgi:hypothetical protein